MSDLRNAVRRMQESARSLFKEPRMSVNIMTHIRAAAEKLERAGENYRVPPLTEIKELLEKLKTGSPLSRREERAIPFALYDPECDAALFASAVTRINWNRASHVRRVLYMYLMCWDHTEKTHTLSLRLQNVFKAGMIETRNKFLQSAAKYTLFLFGDACMNNMAALLINRQSIADVRTMLAFSDTLRGCRFLIEAVKSFFSSDKASLEQKYAVFREIRTEETYQNAYPAAAEYLIPEIKAAETKAAYQKDAMEWFYKLLGDPRFGAKTVRWNEVSEEPRRIFLRWLAENDLNLFFKIIEATAVDRMWRERRAFWAQYLPYITYTKVFFGADASQYARRLDGFYMQYGRLKGCTSDQSVFAFQINNYVFIEWSHNGALRVWDAYNASRVFTAREISRMHMVSNGEIGSWRHDGSWQRNVHEWIERHCGIRV